MKLIFGEVNGDHQLALIVKPNWEQDYDKSGKNPKCIVPVVSLHVLTQWENGYHALLPLRVAEKLAKALEKAIPKARVAASKEWKKKKAHDERYEKTIAAKGD
jgi:hypothetical protein